MVALWAVLALLVLAGCGGADAASSTDSSAEGDTSAATEDEMAAYQECLADQGVELPEMPAGGAPSGDGAQPEPPAEGAEPPADGEAPMGGPGGEGVDREAFAAAQEACAELAPEGMAEGGPGATAGSPGGAGGEELQAYLDSLEEQGVATGQGGQGGGPGQLDESDPAVAACAELRPEMPSGSPGAAGGGTDGAAADDAAGDDAAADGSAS